MRLVEQILGFDQFYSCTVVLLSSLCTPVCHFLNTSAHTLLGPVIVLKCTGLSRFWPMGALQIKPDWSASIKYRSRSGPDREKDREREGKKETSIYWRCWQSVALSVSYKSLLTISLWISSFVPGRPVLVLGLFRVDMIWCLGLFRVDTVWCWGLFRVDTFWCQKFSERITFGGENEIFQNFPYGFCYHLPSHFHILTVFSSW
jgi:hypothetical protein